jgi:hypothetical protein
MWKSPDHKCQPRSWSQESVLWPGSGPQDSTEVANLSLAKLAGIDGTRNMTTIASKSNPQLFPLVENGAR